MTSLEKRKKAFILKAMDVSIDENLDFTLVEYVNNRTKVCIIDRSLMEDGNEYGAFFVTPSNFLKGRRHPDKRKQRISESKRMDKETIICRFKNVHDDNEMLDYSKVEYFGMDKPVCIISHLKREDGSEYGEFWQTPRAHLKGCTHPEIGKAICHDKQRKSLEEFILRCEEVHGGKGYCYDKVVYVNNRTKVDIVCSKHGLFSVSPSNLYKGKGCPKCAKSISRNEEELVSYIEGIIGKDEVFVRDRSVLQGKELDIYVPRYGFALEYNGIVWHSEEFGKGSGYHLSKTVECEEKDVRLVHVFEDSYLKRKEAWKSYIKCCLVSFDGIGNIVEISKEEASVYLGMYGLEGYIESDLYFGLHDSFGDVIGCLCMKKDGSGTYTVTCFGGYFEPIVPFVVERIKKDKSFKELVWMLDRRLFSIKDNVCEHFGFVLRRFIEPCCKLLSKSLKSLKTGKKGISVKVWNCGYLEYVLF